MSWTDKGSIRIIKELRDIFKVKTFVETGAFMGINAELQSKNFKMVFTCEKNKEYYDKACKRIKAENIFIYNSNSKIFLEIMINKIKEISKTQTVMFYLDAHFYDPKAKNKWVILDELKSLKRFKNCIIIIHDFDNNLGHINYDGQSLNLDLIKKDLLKVNPKFKFYTNDISSCDPVTLIKKDIEDAGLEYDTETIDNLEYAWTCPRLTYRGLLYCLPKKVNIKGLREIK